MPLLPVGGIESGLRFDFAPEAAGTHDNESTHGKTRAPTLHR